MMEDTQARIEALLAGTVPKFRRRFLKLVQQLRRERTIESLAALLSAGRFNEALVSAELAAAGLPSVFADQFLNAANKTAEFIGDLVNFDLSDERVVAFLRQTNARMVREFAQGQALATRVSILDGIARGLSPRQQALLFRQSLGLSRSQVIAVQNYRTLLNSLNSSALSRALRDKRFDRTLTRAISSGVPLSQAQVDNMVNRYAEKQLVHRAKVIAETEGLAAVHSGVDAMFRQAAAQGLIEEVRQVWHPQFRNTREHHASMSGQSRPLGEAFISGLGNRLRFPGDPRAPAKDRVNCECIKTTQFEMAEVAA